MIVVDTSVLISLLRGLATPAADRLRRMERQEVPFAIPMICAQEVLQVAKDEREWRMLQEHLSSQRLLASRRPWETHEGAARMYFECRRKGLTLRSTVDCLIAQLTLEAEGVLLHDDEDFERIRQVRPLQTLRG